MTVRQLSELHTLKTEIDRHRQRLQELREMSTGTGHRLDGMPKGSGTRDRISNTVAAIIDEEATLTECIDHLEDHRQQLRRFISTAPTSKLRLILALRFEDGLTWQEVADRAGGTEYSTKQAIYRYLKETESETE